MNAAGRAMIHMMCAKEFAKNRIKEKFLEDEGGFEVIQIILIIAIVLVIAFIFRDNIISFVQGLWDDNVANKGGEQVTTKPPTSK